MYIAGYLDAITLDVYPAQSLVQRSYTATLQDMMQDHLLSLSPREGEAGVKGLLDRRCVCRAVG